MTQAGRFVAGDGVPQPEQSLVQAVRGVPVAVPDRVPQGDARPRRRRQNRPDRPVRAEREGGIHERVP